MGYNTNGNGRALESLHSTGGPGGLFRQKDLLALGRRQAGRTETPPRKMNWEGGRWGGGGPVGLVFNKFGGLRNRRRRVTRTARSGARGSLLATAHYEEH